MSFDEDLPLMLWTARPDMSCEQLSRAWLDLTGFSLEQALGATARSPATPAAASGV